MYIAGANFAQTYSAAQIGPNGKGFGLGDVNTHSDGTVWVFVQATAALGQYDAAVYDETYKTVVAGVTTTNGLRGRNIGVARDTAFAAGDFGWLQVKGPTTMNVLASCAANAQLNTTATAGSPDDDATTGTKELLGVVLTTARGGTNGSAPGTLNWPTIGKTL